MIHAFIHNIRNLNLGNNNNNNIKRDSQSFTVFLTRKLRGKTINCLVLSPAGILSR